MAVFAIRVAVLTMALAAVAVAAVPLLVLLDLVGGGTGYGLCPAGLELCDKPYSTGPELAVVLALSLFALVLGMRLLMKLARKLRDESLEVTQ